MQKLGENVSNVRIAVEIHSKTIENHGNNLDQLNIDVENLKEFEVKIQKKFKKHKEKITVKFNEIDSHISSLISKQDIYVQNINVPKINTNKPLRQIEKSNTSQNVLPNNTEVNNNYDYNNTGSNDDYLAKEFKNFTEKTNKYFSNFEEEIKTIKILMSNKPNTRKVEKADINDKIQESIKDKEKDKILLELITSKLGKEDLEKSNKMLLTEIEKGVLKIKYLESKIK